MKRVTLGLCSILVLSFVLAGCGISKEKYTRLEEENRLLEARMTRILREKDQYADSIQNVESENQMLRQKLSAKDRQMELFQAQRDSMKQSPVIEEPEAIGLDADYK